MLCLFTTPKECSFTTPKECYDGLATEAKPSAPPPHQGRADRLLAQSRRLLRLGAAVLPLVEEPPGPTATCSALFRCDIAAGASLRLTQLTLRHWLSPPGLEIKVSS